MAAEAETGLELRAVRPVDVIPNDDGQLGTHPHLAPRDKWVPSLPALHSPAWEDLALSIWPFSGSPRGQGRPSRVEDRDPQGPGAAPRV